MNVIKWIRDWFRSPVELPARTPEQQLAYEAHVARLNEIEGISWQRKRKLAKLNKDLDDCKKRLEAAVKAKKGGVPALRKELQEKKTQVLREETKG